LRLAALLTMEFYNQHSSFRAWIDVLPTERVPNVATLTEAEIRAALLPQLGDASERVDRLVAAAAGVDDVGTALRVSGIAAILARWSGTRVDEARAVFEREASRADAEPRRDVRAIRRALEVPPRSGCDLL
jgi:hypothetical protein